ncbi:MAG: hypothetical protein ACTSW1_03510 [Candidatus Hodarchaeales archaeon]
MKKWMRLAYLSDSLRDKIASSTFAQRKLVAFAIILSISLTLILMTLVNFLLPFFSIPSFTFENLIVTDLDETSITIDLSINLSTPVPTTVKVEIITCQLNLVENASKTFIASGKTLKSFLIPKNINIVSNISLKLDFIDVQNFLETLTNNSLIEISGKVFFTGGFSHPFSIVTNTIGEGIIPDFEVLDLHPIPPGNILEANVRFTSPHSIILNITRGTLTLDDKNKCLLGTAILSNASIPQGTTNISLLINMNHSELEWVFEEIINNNTFSAEIINFNLTLRVHTKEFSIFMKKVQTLHLDISTDSLEILDIEAITYSKNLFSFDLILGLRGYPLWGYNLSSNLDSNLSISLDFYHKLLNNEIQLVGNGSSNISVTIQKNALVRVPVHIIVFPYASAEMLIVWLRDHTISINIKNGCINLQMYDTILNIFFERLL